jgi:integrase/recombinase XerD
MSKAIDDLKRDLARAAYASRTSSTYVKSVEGLLRHGGVPVEAVDRDRVRAYVDHLCAQGRSASWLTVQLAGLLFFFRRTLGRPQDVSFIKFPRLQSALPEVLSQEEVAAVLGALRDRTYRVIAMVLYGAGLRIDEALSLQVEDVDGARGVLRVRHGKNGQAREAKLSRSLYLALREYWSFVRPQRPHLFGTRRTRRPPTADAVRAALAAAGEEAKITKPVRPHILRHSFATHLLDAGVDIRVIQQLLGHTSPKSTARYTRVSTAVMARTPSPVDLLPSRGQMR